MTEHPYSLLLGLEKGPADDSGLKPIGFEPVSFDYSDPEDHFANYGAIRLWEKYFVFGELMSDSELNFLIERLSAAATQLDHYVARSSWPRINKRRALLNGFLYSAEVTLEIYYKERTYLDVLSSLRQRRPAIKSNTTMPVQGSDDINSSSSEKRAEETRPSRRFPRKLFSALISNCSLIACVTLFTETSWDSPEFYNTASNALMQLLDLYVTILPALRHKNLQSSYSRWSWGLAVLGIIAFVAIGYFRRGPDASQLVLFVGTAVQSTIIERKRD
ncbi:hypothetical protein F5Y08DRAFT_332767 [Xylaria arbuscula]|nr:hypothetical protein F5Y08DRAFT_332767 [Xylaria arbuscula]